MRSYLKVCLPVTTQEYVCMSTLVFQPTRVREVIKRLLSSSQFENTKTKRPWAYQCFSLYIWVDSHTCDVRSGSNPEWLVIAIQPHTW